MNEHLKRRIFWNLLDGSGFKVLEGCLNMFRLMSTSNADMYTYFFRKSISIEMFHLQVQLHYFFQNFRLHLTLISGRIFFFFFYIRPQLSTVF